MANLAPARAMRVPGNRSQVQKVMRILEVIDSLSVGGAEVLLKDLCRVWRESDAEVTVYLLHSTGGWIEDQLLANGTRIVRSGLSSPYSPWQVVRLARHLQQEKYDVIHVHLFPAQLWVRLAASLVGLTTPLMTTEHNTWNRRRRLGFRSLDRFLYARYDSVVCISEASAANLRAWLAPHPCSPRVIPNGIDASRFHHCREADSRKADCRQAVCHTSDPPQPGVPQHAVLLCVGSLTNIKNQSVIIRALLQIPDAELILAGEGPMRVALETAASDLGVRERVHLVGERSDIPDLLSAADVYIHSSLVDGFCLAVVEAMAAGVPVVVSNIPGMREVVGDGGISFDPQRPRRWPPV